MAHIREHYGSYQCLIRIKGHPTLAKSFKSKTDAKTWTLQTELKIPIIDINKDLFERYPDPLSLIAFRSSNSPAGHFNELGFKLVSKIILRKIIEYEKN